MEPTPIILSSKSKEQKNPMKSFLLEDTSIPGILDHKLEPMTMEEDLSLCLRLLGCF